MIFGGDLFLRRSVAVVVMAAVVVVGLKDPNHVPPPCLLPLLKTCYISLNKKSSRTEIKM